MEKYKIFPKIRQEKSEMIVVYYKLGLLLSMIKKIIFINPTNVKKTKVRVKL